MRGIFIGPAAHWLLLVMIVALGWLGGRVLLHVRDFNLFAVLVLLGAVLCLLAVLATARPGRRVTRDALEDDEA